MPVAIYKNDVMPVAIYKNDLMPVAIYKNDNHLLTLYNVIFSNMKGILSHLRYIFY